MKYLFTFFFIPLFLLSSTSQKETLVGKWIGEDQNEIGYLIFDNEGYAAFEVNGLVMGGKEFIMKGKKGKMTYTVNYNTTPIEVDLKVTKIESGESQTILAIAEFTKKNIINFNMNFNNIRPTEFDEKSIVFRRVN